MLRKGSSNRVQAGTLVEHLRWRATCEPDRRALSFLQDGDRGACHLTNAELDHAARVVAAHLQRTAQPGDRVLLVYPPGLAYITAFLGCLYAGVVAVPTYPLRPNRSWKRFDAMIRDAQPRLILTSSDLESTWQQRDAEGDQIRPRVLTETLTDSPTDWHPPDVEPASLAFLQYTSGSTGTPKGVMISHDNLLHNLQVIESRFEHSAQSVGVIWLPPYHDMGLIGGILQPLYVGFPVVLMSPLACIQRPLRWLQAITQYGATTSGGPNFAYDWCVDRIAEAKRADLDLSTWDVAFNGAGPILPATLERFADAFAPFGFRRHAFYPCYGLAESTLYVTGGAKAAEPVVQRPHGHTRPLVGCGQPALRHQLVIADPETHHRCPEGVEGEIWARGPSVARGYWNRPAETAAVFAAHLAGEARLADSGDGPFLRTGDLGLIQQGELFVTGRIKELIIIDGRNLYPHDIENTVSQCHPGLRAGGGVAFAIDTKGDEQLVLVHEVVREWLQKPLAPLLSAIRQSVATEYEVPVYGIALVKPGRIPKTSSGKPQRVQCRHAYLQGRLDAVLTWWAEMGEAAVQG